MILRHYLTGSKRVLNPDYPTTLATVNNIGLVLERQGDNKEAEAMHRRALRGYEKVLGLDHPDMLTIADNLASVLESQGKYVEANTILQKAKGRTSY